MLATRCTISRKETMTDNSVLDQLMRIRYDLTAAQGKLTDAMETIAALNLSGAKRPRAGSPRELHPDACPHCELAAGHTAECPTVTGENPNYGPGNPDYDRDLKRVDDDIAALREHETA